MTNRKLYVPGVTPIEGPAEDPATRVAPTYTPVCRWVSADGVATPPGYKGPRWFVSGPLPQPDLSDTVLIKRSDGLRQLAELDLILDPMPHHLWWYAAPRNVREQSSRDSLLDADLRDALEELSLLFDYAAGRRATTDLVTAMTERVAVTVASYRRMKGRSL